MTNTGIFLMVDLSARYQDKGTRIDSVTGGTKVYTGPIVMVYRKNVMARIGYSFPVYEKVFDTQFSRGKMVNLGIGMTF